ncbi:MAG: hypothetical protein HUU02_14440 [Bacteroidetes bacterium]|nr:hypothetical protein [Bacteroidota bacterium]
MNIHIIGTRGWSYAGAEDLVREFGPRFIRDGHSVTIHAWGTKETDEQGITRDVIQNGVVRIFHKTNYGKYTGQFLIALKSTWAATFSDADVIYYSFIQNGIYSWFPRLFGKKIFINVDGIMWKDPKWPPVFRHLFFPLGAYLCWLFANKIITDSRHMQSLYRRKFGLRIDWAGYGCSDILPEKQDIDLCREYPDGYYIIMSRQTPHNLTDIMVDGYIRSGVQRPLLIAGHIPDNAWFRSLQERAKGHPVRWLGLIKDQEYLTQVLLNARAYLHGHSLGGINPALVRVVGMDIPTIAIDTIFNREVLEEPNGAEQACFFRRDSTSVAEAILRFESAPERYRREAHDLGVTIRRTMSWEAIYTQYRSFMMSL